YKRIPQIVSFTDKEGKDNMKEEIDANYKRIKSDIAQIIENEIERIKDDPNLQHLLN
ncbi:MAG: conjugal transfer protein TraG, partial [Chryseobacterium sp.]